MTCLTSGKKVFIPEAISLAAKAAFYRSTDRQSVVEIMNAVAEAITRNRFLVRAIQFLLTYAAAASVGLVAGFVSATGNLALVAIFSGLVVAAGLMSSSRALLWFIIIGGLVVTGAAQLYLPGSKYLRYIVRWPPWGWCCMVCWGV